MIKQRGNILFLILLAVVLFAALSYAVTQSTRGGGNDASSEKSKTIAAEITQYGSLLENTVQRMRLSNGCADYQISFENPVVSGYTSSFPLADKRCNVFDPAGGGMAWKTLPVEWLDPYFTSWSANEFGKIVFPYYFAFNGIGTTLASGSDISTVDLVLIVPFLTDNICKAINSQLGLPFPYLGNVILPNTGGKFRGSFTGCGPSSCNYQNSLSSTAYTGSINYIMSAGCVTGQAIATPEPGKTGNAYFHVLWAR